MFVSGGVTGAAGGAGGVVVTEMVGWHLGTSALVTVLMMVSRCDVGIALMSVGIVSSVGTDGFSNMVGKGGAKSTMGVKALLDLPRGELPVLPKPLDPRVECGRMLTSLI